MTRMTGGRALVEMLHRNGVDTLFALPGVQNDHLFNALYDAGTIRVVHTRHEQGAAYMAYGYARSTGKVGAYSVVPGPGFLNTTAALSTAYAANAPVFCVTGQITSGMIGRGFGFLHELPDQLSIIRGLTKWAARAEHPALIGPTVNEAFRQLRSGRPRPVGIEVPLDVLEHETELQLPGAADIAPPLAPDPAVLAQAVELLAGARLPLIMVGSGADGAGEELREVAELLQAPVAANSTGHGALSDRHPLSIKGPMAHRFWKDADVVLAVGTRLQRMQADWGVDDLKIVRIDLDMVEISRFRKPAVGMVADARLALAAIRDALKARGVQNASREAEVAAVRAPMEEQWRQGLQPQFDFLAAIRDALPDDGFLVDEMTQVGYASRYAFPVYRPRGLITSGYQGTLGYGFATALGVKVANPDKAVVSINGDGGFMFTVQELATAVQHGIGVVAVVFADKAFGNVLRMQKELHGGRVIATDLRNPDFSMLARSFGADAACVTTATELRDAVAAGLASGRPTVIEVPVGAMPSPQRFFMLPRVRGKAP